MVYPRSSSLLVALSTVLVGCPDEDPVVATPETETDAPGSDSGADTGNGGACVPGETNSCTCTGADVGVQTCVPDGSGYDECVCVGEDDTGGTSDGTGGECGDGAVDPGEECDDGNDDDEDECTNACEDAICGDGIVGPDEQCDDGNDDDTDRCTNLCAIPECGNGVVDPLEECDDGNRDDTDACPSTCLDATCGDAYVWANMEECDDGNAEDDDACLSVCVSANCGDGIVWAGVEACDDGNLEDADECTNACTLPSCGDGIVQAGEECDDADADNGDECLDTCASASCGDGELWGGVEECDDANGDDGDDCPSTCEFPYCGDGFVWAGVETCDDGNPDDIDACLSTCEPASCGDGFVWAGMEACDDGNLVDDDGCTNGCSLPACGDGIVQPGEQCDDANLDNSDGCIDTCAVAICGDSHLWAGVEACDDGNFVATDGCTNSCVPASCGDGIVWAGVEECDDADLDNTDGCLANCGFASCGDGFVWAGMETCDDGNLDDSDACPGTCEPASCGDGFVWAGTEECDDGNLINDDLCTNACALAECGDGILQPGEQCDDGNVLDIDGCLSNCTNASCGDGVVWGGVEDCDDGNGSNDDACSVTCTDSYCGDGVVWGGAEECDDGNINNGDGCENDCTVTIITCPNGMIDAGEACDDDNFDNTDACTDQCELAACGDGFLQPVNGEECDDGNLDNGDGCSLDCVFEACHCFDTTLELPIADDARDMEVADLDQDGHLDLVVAGTNSNTVELWFGNGVGGFGMSGFAANGPRAVAVGDVDGDADLDLVLIETSTLTVWLNDGVGGFIDSGLGLGASNPSGHLELADLDGDGDLDAVAGTTTSTQFLRVFLGDGVGGFAASSVVPVGYNPVDLEIVDVDGDGNVDLSARTSGVHGLVAFGDGSGAFPAESVAGYAGPDASDGAGRFGDVDEDGDLDWVVLGSGRSWVRRATGFGSGVTTQFAPAQLVRSGGLGSDLRLVDLNADGHLDMLGILANDVVYKLGDGLGGFGGTAKAGGGTPGNPTDLGYGDFDEDGILDVVTLVPGSDEAVIFWGASDPLAPGCESTCGGGSCGDGQVDLLSEACDGEADCSSCSWQPPPECGDGIVDPGTLCYANAVVRAGHNSWEIHGVDGADLDSDGRGDLLIGMRDNQFPAFDNSYWGVYWDLGEGALQWSNHSAHMTNNYSWQCRSDPRVYITQLNTNVDTIPDFAISCYNAGVAWAVVTAFGDGDTSFSGMDEAHDDLHSPTDSALGDFDEDGHLDLVTSSDHYGGQSTLNNGNGSFAAPVDYNGVANNGHRVRTGDANADNDLDIFALRTNGTMWVFLGDGTGSFPSHVEFSTGMDEMVVVDVDDDGDLDIVGASSGGEVETAINDGLAGFVVQGPYLVGENGVTSIGGLDADGDGALDMVVTSNGGVTILRGLGDGSFEAGVNVHSASGMKDTYVEDLNGDGIDDIVATRTVSEDGSMLVILSDP